METFISSDCQISILVNDASNNLQIVLGGFESEITFPKFKPLHPFRATCNPQRLLSSQEHLDSFRMICLMGKYNSILKFVQMAVTWAT